VSDGHRTTAIPRPRQQTRAQEAGGDGGRGGIGRDNTRFGDLTRPIAVDKRLVQGRRNRALLTLGGLVLITAIVAALFVLPVNTWLQQRSDLADKQRRLDVIAAANDQLTGEVARLQTEDGIKEAAREVIGYTEVGEVRISASPAPEAPLTLPAGWPYDAVSQIIAVRSADAPAVP
jgi:cell division protein FtsB